MSLDWSQGSLYQGMRCFDCGEFFEAHEHWELVWLASSEPEKTFLQGLIQIAASFHHFQRENRVGTASLLRASLRRLARYPETFAGIEVAALCSALREWIEALEKVPPVALPPIPKIRQSHELEGE